MIRSVGVIEERRRVRSEHRGNLSVTLYPLYIEGGGGWGAPPNPSERRCDVDIFIVAVLGIVVSMVLLLKELGRVYRGPKRRVHRRPRHRLSGWVRAQNGKIRARRDQSIWNR